MIHQDAFIHSSSVVDEPCRIGAGTRIWHFSHVEQGAVIGEHCTLGQNVYIGKGVVLGNGVKVQNNVSLYSGCHIESDVFLGPGCVFTNVKNPRAAIERKDEFMPTLIKKGATIGANATILCGITLGAHCFIGAGAVVTKDVPDFALMTGNPARQTGTVDEAGDRCRE